MSQNYILYMDDPVVLTGISKLVNKNKVNNTLDLDAIERDIISMGGLDAIPTEASEVSEESDESVYSVGTVSGSAASSQYASPVFHRPSRTPTKNYRSPPVTKSEPTPRRHKSRSRPPPPPKNHYESAYNVYSKTPFVPDENLDEKKEKMLGDIEELMDELESDNVSVAKIPLVNSDSSYRDVERVYRHVKRKYNRSRCEDLGNGVILVAARALEMMFDGKKSYLGWKPDMTGWHRTVRSKLRRLRYEQSLIVSGITEKYKIGPVARMGLELGPSALLYSLTKREQHNQNNYMPSNVDRSEVLDDLREFS